MIRITVSHYLHKSNQNQNPQSSKQSTKNNRTHCGKVSFNIMQASVVQKEALYDSKGRLFIDHFSGPGTAIDQYVCICLDNNIWTNSVRWFILTLSSLSSKVKIIVNGELSSFGSNADWLSILMPPMTTNTVEIKLIMPRWKSIILTTQCDCSSTTELVQIKIWSQNWTSFRCSKHVAELQHYTT